MNGHKQDISVKDALVEGINILKNAGIETPAVDAGVMLCFVLGCDRVYIYTHGERILCKKEQDAFFNIIRDRAKRKPVQYITAHQEFMSIPFYVNTSVLIPRQDTEVLVESVLAYVCRNSSPNLYILDMGTGSGCIAVSLAANIEQSRFLAADISSKALETAYINAVNAGVNKKIKFILSDLFDELRNLPMQERLFDIIVSNPPYISDADIEILQKEVKDFEPLHALRGGPDGLCYYRSIINQSVDFLKPGGLLAFEVGFGQAQEVSALMQDKFAVDIIKDLSGIDRVVTGRLKQ